MFRLTVMDSDRWIADGISLYFSRRSIQVNIIMYEQAEVTLQNVLGSDVVISELYAFDHDMQTFIELFLKISQLSPSTKIIILTGLEEKAILAYVASLLPMACVLSKRCEITKLVDEVFSHIPQRESVQVPPVIKQMKGVLTTREFSLLRMLAANKSLTEIGHLLQVSVRTVSYLKKNVMLKLNCRTKGDLSSLLRRMGFGNSPP